jgi:hypothetical protein
MHRQVKGVFRNGKVELSEKLDAVDGTEVIVSVAEPATPRSPGKMITFGMFANSGRGRMSTEEDIREAKGLWEREWERSWDRLERQ